MKNEELYQIIIDAIEAVIADKSSTAIEKLRVITNAVEVLVRI